MNPFPAPTPADFSPTTFPRCFATCTEVTFNHVEHEHPTFMPRFHLTPLLIVRIRPALPHLTCHSCRTPIPPGSPRESRAYLRSYLLLLFSISSLPDVCSDRAGHRLLAHQRNRLLDTDNQPVRIAGINWYGFETAAAVANGLTTQDYKVILQTIKTQGYNTIRIPLSNQLVEAPSPNPNIGYSHNDASINSDLKGLDSLQVLDKIVTQAGALGLKIILDNHRSEAGDSAESSGLWYIPAYPESAWLADWAALATRYLDNPTVIGFDLRNEPHNASSGGACWDCGGPRDWHLAARAPATPSSTSTPTCSSSSRAPTPTTTTSTGGAAISKASATPPSPSPSITSSSTPPTTTAPASTPNPGSTARPTPPPSPKSGSSTGPTSAATTSPPSGSESSAPPTTTPRSATTPPGPGPMVPNPRAIPRHQLRHPLDLLGPQRRRHLRPPQPRLRPRPHQPAQADIPLHHPVPLERRPSPRRHPVRPLAPLAFPPPLLPEVAKRYP